MIDVAAIDSRRKKVSPTDMKKFHKLSEDFKETLPLVNISDIV